MDNAYIIDEAFSLDRLLDIMDVEPQKEKKFNNFDLKNIDFIMVDNISNMISYTSQEKIEEFIKDLIEAIKKLTIVYGIVLIDNQTNPEIQKIVQKHFDNTVTIKDEWI